MTPTERLRVGPSVVNEKGSMRWLTAVGRCALLFLVLTAWTAIAAPDLIVVDLELDPPAPLPGTNVALTATIENIGDDDAEAQFFVRFEVDGLLLESLPVHSDLRPGRTKTLTTSWIAEEGEHAITAEADRPFDRILEADESNNAESIDVYVPFPLDIAERVGGVHVAVGQFEDRSASGFVNVGDGVGDKLSERLEQVGIRVVNTDELAEAMQQLGLNPYLRSDAVTAAGLLGADFLVEGTVAEISSAESSLSLVFFSVGGGSADVSLDASVVSVPTAETLFGLSSDGHYEGVNELSFDFGPLLSLPGATDVCAGGLASDREAYYGSESVLIGYANALSAAWFSVEIHTSTGTFIRWLGWQYIASGGCGTWHWDQRDSFGAQAPPNVYLAKLWDGASYIASKTFQIQPGVSLFPLVDEITIGSESFEDSIVGGAVNRAVDQLVSSLVQALEGIVPSPTARASGAAFEAVEAPVPSIEGRIAAVLPDGRIAINIGATSGVSRGDFFLVFSAADPIAHGEVVIVEVRDSVSYALKASDFIPTIGDIIRRAEP